MTTTAHATIEHIYSKLMRVGTGAPYSASDACSTNGETLFFIGTVCGTSLADAPQSPVYRTGRSGELTALHPGPAKLLELSPGGAQLAFAVTDHAAGCDRLVVATADGDVVSDLPTDGRIEQIGWSPDGASILLLVAGAGTDTTTLAGSISDGAERVTAAWHPVVDDGASDPEDWRRLSIYDLGRSALGPPLDIAGMVWKASWCGDASIAVLLSESSGEAAWYRAALALVDRDTTRVRILCSRSLDLTRSRGQTAHRSSSHRRHRRLH